MSTAKALHEPEVRISSNVKRTKVEGSHDDGLEKRKRAHIPP